MLFQWVPLSAARTELEPSIVLVGERISVDRNGSAGTKSPDRPQYFVVRNDGS
jgi:hypothetical protein